MTSHAKCRQGVSVPKHNKKLGELLFFFILAPSLTSSFFHFNIWLAHRGVGLSSTPPGCDPLGHAGEVSAMPPRAQRRMGTASPRIQPLVLVPGCPVALRGAWVTSGRDPVSVPARSPRWGACESCSWLPALSSPVQLRWLLPSALLHRSCSPAY